MTSMDDTKMQVEPTGLDESDDDRIVYLVSSNGDRVPVCKKYVKMSKVIWNALDMEKDATEFKMPQVGAAERKDGHISTETVQNMVKYFEHHKGVASEFPTKPLNSNDISKTLKDPWDAEFLKSLTPKREPLYNLVLAANFLDIKCLLHKASAQVACLVKGRTGDHIKTSLDPAVPHRQDGLPDDIVPNEVKVN